MLNFSFSEWECLIKKAWRSLIYNLVPESSFMGDRKKNLEKLFLKTFLGSRV